MKNISAKYQFDNIKAKNRMKKFLDLAKLKGATYVKVGIVRGGDIHPNAGGVTIAEIAWWNEFGTRRGIHERPFLRWTLRENKYYRNQLKNLMENILKKGGGNRLDKLEMGLKILGALASSDIRKMIRTGSFKANKKKTITRKSTSSGIKNRPLIDTGTLLNSISYQLVKERILPQ